MGHAVITGASRGVGAALGAELVARGHQVTGLSQSGGAGTIRADVTDLARLEEVARGIAGPVDMLICNAGILEDRGMRVGDADLTPEIWTRMLAVNVTGVANTVTAFLPHLKRSDAGRIAVIASQMGSSRQARGDTVAYRVSKAAAINLALNLASDLAVHGIAVAAYHPGWVQTDMGGAGASITPEDSARGLADRLQALNIATTGAFETWDGRPHPL